MVTPFAQGGILRAARSAEPVSIHSLIGGGTLLVLAPHPDDETLGCGAALAAASQSGCAILVVSLTDGRLSHARSESHPAERLIALRAQELLAAVEILTDGRGRTVHLGYADQGMSSAHIAEACTRLKALCAQCEVDTLWTTWEGDPHPDHQAAAQIARHVVRARRGMALWRFPVWGRFVERVPQADERLFTFDGRAFEMRKAKALAAHRSQMTPLITDDPEGFVMDAHMQAHFLTSPELFISETRHGGSHTAL